MTHSQVERSALWVCVGLLSLHALMVFQATGSLIAAQEPVPIRVNAEVGVVSLGSWVWVYAPLATNLFVLAVNALLYWRVRAVDVRRTLVLASCVCTLLALFGAAATVRAALVSIRV